MTKRSAEAKQSHKFYKSKHWFVIRRVKLAKNPLCERCLRRGVNTLATVVHHKVPHKGDWSRFLDMENLESLCKACHDSDAQQEDDRGYSEADGPDGFKLDPRHPTNRREKSA